MTPYRCAGLMCWMITTFLPQVVVVQVVVVQVGCGGGVAAASSLFTTLQSVFEVTTLQELRELRATVSGGPRTLPSMRDTAWHLEEDSDVPSHVEDIHPYSHTRVMIASSSSAPPTDDSLTHWRRLKGIFANMKSILTRLYEAETESGHVPIAALDKMEAVGDSILMVKSFYKSLDPELRQYLLRRLEGFWGDLTEGNPLLRIVNLPNITEATETLVPKMLIKLGHFLHHQAVTFVDELDFVLELMKSSGFTEDEIYFIFQLLGLPQTSEPRQARESNSQFGSNIGFRRDSRGGYGYSGGGYGQSGGGYGQSGSGNGQLGGGYGHSGGGSSASGSGYSGGGGYGGYMQYMPKHDPFVILAGLAFLTLCSYVTYLILSSIHTKRSLPELPLSLDLSDVPVLVTMVEQAQQLYDPSGEELTDVTEALSLAFNNLWKSYRMEPESGACVRRYLCQHLLDPGLPHLLRSDEAFRYLNVLGLAQVLGVKEAARSADQVYIRWLQGHPGPSASCTRSTPQCSDLGSDTSTDISLLNPTVEEETMFDGKMFRVTAEPK